MHVNAKRTVDHEIPFGGGIISREHAIIATIFSLYFDYCNLCIHPLNASGGPAVVGKDNAGCERGTADHLEMLPLGGREVHISTGPGPYAAAEAFPCGHRTINCECML